jgi:DDE superfamily endonuclease
MIQPRRCRKQKSKMFWAAFGYSLRTQLIPMDSDLDSTRGGVTAQVYKLVLEQHLIPILRFGDIFMQDNALIHIAYIIRDWFIENGIEVMKWPLYTLDLNPIKNIWALLKAEIYRRYPVTVRHIHAASTALGP